MHQKSTPKDTNIFDLLSSDPHPEQGGAKYVSKNEFWVGRDGVGRDGGPKQGGSIWVGHKFVGRALS